MITFILSEGVRHFFCSRAAVSNQRTSPEMGGGWALCKWACPYLHRLHLMRHGGLSEHPLACFCCSLVAMKRQNGCKPDPLPLSG
jgi:hypothetical protein